MKLLLITASALALTACITAADAAPRSKSPYKTCPDGTLVRANQKCPTAPVPPAFSVQDVTISEGGGTAAVHILKTGANGLSSSISYGTIAGTATPGSDFTAVSGGLTVPAGTTDLTVTIPITDDSTVEGNETFGVSITGDTNASVARRTGTITITDNDVAAPAATPSFSVQDAMVNENAGTVTVHIIKADANGSSSTITYATANASATTPGDYTSASGTLIFADGDTDKTVTVPITDDSTVETTETFALNITASSNAVASRNGTVTIMDNDSNPVTPGYVDSPTLAGLAPVTTSDFDRSTAIVPFPPTPSNSPDVVGAFRFICGPAQLLYDDPIVYPGQPGRSHLHQFYGNTGANAYSTYTSLRTTGGSSCNQTGLATALNRSAYWMPAMLDGKGHVIQPDYVAIYYKQSPASSTDCTSGLKVKACVALPNGIRFIFGRDMLNLASSSTGAFHFQCIGLGDFPTMDQALAVCGVGSRFEVVGDAPLCWDGKYIDTPDHRSHMAYMIDSHLGYTKCPDDHPYGIPAFTISTAYSIVAGDDTSGWKFSSDAMAPTEPRGSTYHTDFWMAWDPTTAQTWHDNCLNKMLNSASGDLCNGTGLKGATAPPWGFGVNPNHSIAVP